MPEIIFENWLNLLLGLSTLELFNKKLTKILYAAYMIICTFSVIAIKGCVIYMSRDLIKTDVIGIIRIINEVFVCITNSFATMAILSRSRRISKLITTVENLCLAVQNPIGHLHIACGVVCLSVCILRSIFVFFVNAVNFNIMKVLIILGFEVPLFRMNLCVAEVCLIIFEMSEILRKVNRTKNITQWKVLNEIFACIDDLNYVSGDILAYCVFMNITLLVADVVESIPKVTQGKLVLGVDTVIIFLSSGVSTKHI